MRALRPASQDRQRQGRLAGVPRAAALHQRCPLLHTPRAPPTPRPRASLAPRAWPPPPAPPAVILYTHGVDGMLDILVDEALEGYVACCGLGFVIIGVSACRMFGGVRGYPGVHGCMDGLHVVAWAWVWPRGRGGAVHGVRVRLGWRAGGVLGRGCGRRRGEPGWQPAGGRRYADGPACRAAPAARAACAQHPAPAHCCPPCRPAPACCCSSFACSSCLWWTGWAFERPLACAGVPPRP